MKIVVCASVVFSDKIIEIYNRLESDGHKVDIPYVTRQIKEGKLSLEKYILDKQKNGDLRYRESYANDVDMIKRYYNLIKNCNAILVLNYSKNDIENYIGGSVLMEMSFAYVSDKKIFLLNPVPNISYSDELVSMKPIILNGDLNKITSYF